jgi:SPX domain protein involved in polyphosphate accumulation
MSFRVEKKYLLNNKNLPKFYNFLKKKNFKKLYPDRQIYSYYFDNSENKMHVDSEEGLTPRKKIRLRWYNNFLPKKNLLLEKKINSVEGRFKLSNNIDLNNFNLLIDRGIFDNYYGKCNSKIIISYYRSYFISNHIRITLDKNIKYIRNLLSNTSYRDMDDYIVEFKYQKLGWKPEILTEMPGTEIRSSKYSNGMNYFLNLNLIR